MASAGFLCLAAALAISLYGIGASLYGARAGRREYVDSGRRAVYAMAGMLVVAMLILQLAFVRSDFSFELVATHSSTTTPLFYRLTAVWSSQEGSLLLWVLLLSLWSSAILFATRRSLREVAPVRDRRAARLRRLLHRAARLPRVAVHPARRAAGRGHRAEPAAAPPEHDDPPADALLGLHAVRDPVRVRDRRADHAAARLGVDPQHAPVHARGVDVPRLRDPARRPLVLHGARLGRLLGLGPGRERVADAVADRHRVPALGDDPGEARDAEGLERLARARHRRARDPRHVPRPLGDPRVDPRLRRLDARRPVPRR